jgi:methanogenic corrinoid protein MtbC1
VAAVLRGARSEAMALIAGDTGRSVGERMVLIAAAQREIGRLWEENRISVAEEHLATAISHLALARLFDEAPMARANGRRIVVACVEGELHDFPARLAADTLELAGFRVLFLGANVPTDHLLPLLAREQPDLLALSIAMTFHLPALKAAVARVRVQQPAMPILVGGHACAWLRDPVGETGADGSGRDAAALLATARQLLGVTP